MTPQKKFDVMVVGELNVDIIFNRLHSAPELGKEQKAENMTLTLGSSTAIFASNIAKLGSDTAFCGKIGSDSFGNLVRDSLRFNGVHTGYILVDENLLTGATSIYNYSGDRMMVTFPGAMEYLSVEDIPEKLFKESRHLHTSSIFFQPGLKKNLAHLFKKAKDFGLSTSMDTQWDPEEKWDLDFKTFLPYLDFFLPNEQEVLNLTGTSSVEKALHYFSAFQTCVVVKRGEKGAVMQYNGNQTSIPAYHITEFSDAVGAGDSFNAGFIHEYLSGSDLEACLRTGNAAAAVSTTQSGGTGGIQGYKQVFEKIKSFELKSS